MTATGKREASAAKTWATVLGFLLVLMAVLGAVAHFSEKIAGPRFHSGDRVTAQQAGARH